MDLSPISIKSLMNSHHPCGIMAIHLKYGIKRFSTLAHISGAGYRVLAKLDHTGSTHTERILSMWTKMSLPLELWLGRGRPLNPYLRGVIIDFLIKEMKPRDLSLPPDALFVSKRV